MTSTPSAGPEPENPRPLAEPQPAEPFTVPYAPPPETGANPYREWGAEPNPNQPAGFGQPHQQPVGPYPQQPYPPAYPVPVAPLLNPYAPPVEPIHFPPEIWLVFVSAALAIVAAFIPWFRPEGTYLGRRALVADHALYSWQDGRIGLLAPVLLVIFAISIVRMMRGTNRFAGRRSGPVTSVGRWALGVGLVTLLSVLIAYAMLPSQFSVPASAGGSWNGASRLGFDMSRNPQTGLWLTVTAAGLCVLSGLTLIVDGTRHRPAGR